ncbi:hypothetical protein K438DRAFT_1562207, partial [Mycena galopus ATCC 62051]
YKKKKLGHPSEKLSGDVARTDWRAVLWAEVVFPLCMALLFSFPINGKLPPSPLVRIAVIALGPIAWNAVVLLVLFFVSLFLGPMLDSVWPPFGSFVAALAHLLRTIRMIGFFEFFVSPSWLFFR